MEKHSHIEPNLEKVLTGHLDNVTALFYNRHEKLLASSSLDKHVMVWDLNDGCQKSFKFQGHKEAVMDVTFSPSGKYLASASSDKTVRIWLPSLKSSTSMFKAHTQSVRSVQYSPDGSKIITASNDQKIKLWTSERPTKSLASFIGHRNWVTRATISGDGALVASCSKDKTTRLWNPETTQCVHIYNNLKGYGMTLTWHPSCCHIALGTSKGKVNIFDIRTHKLVQYYSIHKDAINQVVFHPSGNYLLTSSKDGNIKILDILKGQPIYTLCGHKGGVNAATFSPSGQEFATSGDDKMIFLWNTNFTKLGDVEVSDEKKWYQCYHSKIYPETNFVQDNGTEISNHSETSFQDVPNANSTMIDSTPTQNPGLQSGSSTPIVNSENPFGNLTSQSYGPYRSADCSSFSVGHISHIPRPPPTPATYSLPTMIRKSIGTEKNEDIFGMIKLGDNDVCYTSGTIEWVGRKRSFPLNSGFKILHQNQKEPNEPTGKKVKKLDVTYTKEVNRFKECDCADVLPTVNAIVDHLNALHEAVDLVDLRLNNLEDVVAKNNQDNLNM